MSEKRYTLAEAEKIRRLDSCARHGHSWSVIDTRQNGPIRVTCDDCGWSGVVTMQTRPLRPTGIDNTRETSV